LGLVPGQPARFSAYRVGQPFLILSPLSLSHISHNLWRAVGEHETLNMKNETLNMKNETLNMKNETLNMKHETLNMKH
jgi:hypothetical protein